MATTTWDQKSGMTSATEVDNVETLADQAAASANAADASATAAAASAAAAADSETASDASETAAAASAAAAASSATSASGSAATATTKAAEAASSAAAAQTAQTAAEAAQTAAETAQTGAETAETNAAASASSASSSATAAAASYDNFDDRYLGAKASDPTLDNDGDALITGALYFNTTDDVMKVYDGAAWVAAYVSLGDALLASNNLSDLANAATARTNLGLGTAATTASTDYATAAQGALADSALQSADIGVSVQGYSAVLAATTASYTTAEETKLVGIEALADVTDATNVAAAGAAMTANNLSDLADAATSRTNLGLGTGDSPTFTGVTTTGTVAAADLTVNGNAYPSAGALSNRNRIINGNFDVWQRGTSGSAGMFFVADRWKNYGSGTTHAVSQQSFTIGQTDVPNEPEFFHRSVITSSAGASNFAATQHRIENVRTFAGQSATLSFWAKADASKNIAVEFAQEFGTGGSAEVTGVGVTTCNLTTDWQKFTITANFPSISGKTVGPSSVMSITFWLDAGSDYNARTNSLGQQSGTFDIAQVQLEAGDTATPFEHRSYGQELALCQRYYIRWQSAGTSSFPAIASGYISAANGANYVVATPVALRATPTVSFSGSVYGAHGTTSLILSSIFAVYQASGTNFWMNVIFTTSTGTVGQGGLLYCQDNVANFVEASAEL